MAKITNLDGKWTPLIGRFVIAFGHIESHVLDFLTELPRDPVSSYAKSKMLNDKIELLSELISQNTCASPLIVKLASLLTQTKALLPQRNIVVHNPLSLRIFQLAKKTSIEEQIISRRNHGKYVTYEQLTQLTISAETIESSLRDLLNSFLATKRSV